MSPLLVIRRVALSAFVTDKMCPVGHENHVILNEVKNLRAAQRDLH